MNKFKNFVKLHWDELLIVFVTALLLLIVIFPFFLSNSLDQFDTPGLLSLSWFIKEHTFPDFQGWNPYFFGGFPQGVLYPPLFHYLVAALAKVFSLFVAYKLTISIITCLIPFSIYEFSLKIYKQKTWALLNTFVLLILLILLPGYLGFNFDGVLDYGLGPSFASIPVFFIFLTKLFDRHSKAVTLAVVFTILILTHLLTAVVAGLIVLGYYSATWSKNKQLKNFVLFSAFTLCLSAFWVVPFIYFRQFAVTGFSQTISITFPIFIFILTFVSVSVLLIKNEFSKKTKLLALLKVSFFVSILGILDSLLNAKVSNFKIPLVHPFRIQIYGIILSFCLLTYLIKTLHPFFIKTLSKLSLIKFIKHKPHLFTSFFFLLFTLVFLSFIRLDPFGPQEVKLEKFDWKGRIGRTYKISDVLNQSRAVIDKAVMQNPDNFAVDGLLKESSYLAPYYQSLSKNLNSENYNWKELDKTYIENTKLSESKTKFAADLLWVKTLFVTTKDIPDCREFKEVARFKTNTLTEGFVDQTIYACSYIPAFQSSLVEPITTDTKVVKENFEQTIEKWWKSDNEELITNKKLIKDKLAPSSIIKTDICFEDNHQAFKITADQQEESYFLLKISYFPKWKVYDQEGKHVEIIRTSPNFQTVPIKKEVVFRYERTTVENLSLFVSFMSWIAVILITTWKLVKKCNFFPLNK